MTYHKSSQSSNAVNGQSCSYARLKTYANCARAEKPRVAAAAPEKFRMENYLDPSPTSLPGGANTGEKNYTPSYNVPNYPPITLDVLTSATATCGGYKQILGAYSGMNGTSCTTNYINN